MTMRRTLILVSILSIASSAFLFAAEEDSDIVYLNNGGKVSGIISKEGTANIELETIAGTIAISRAGVKSVHHASPKALDALRDKWEGERLGLKAQEKTSAQEREDRLKAYGEWVKSTADNSSGKEREASEVKIVRDPDSNAVLVGAVLNDDVKTVLVVDTGASIVVLSKSVGDKLGIDTSDTPGNAGGDIVQLHLAGGQTVKGRIVILKSLSINGVEEHGIQAAVLLEEKGNIGFKDGLLGRSFLNRFSINIDAKKMTMTLQKLQ